MSLISEVTLSVPIIFFEDAFDREPDAVWTLEAAHDLTDDSGGTYYVSFWWLTGCPAPDFEAALDADPTVRCTRQVCSLNDRTLFRVKTVSFPPEQPLLVPTLRAHDATHIDATRDAEGLHVRARFPDRDALNAFLDAAEAVGRRADVHRLYAAESGPADSHDLTERQRAALELAHERGYYETPSEVTLEALAEEFGVTPQTLSRHLRVAVEKVVADAVRPGTPRLQDPSQ
ncbi:helix-turn-helix domain-containing protein [Halobacterium jilantaiense]|uniref:GAF and HTH_10 associated domain-containing protein n=1 Tax=Halobacterium jilantaiense TaxID=355548 RepID=A0A1I0N3M3_9EURY|nr:helix-turn-helix domain-containing protein [Halobacterium jilantaiense]SEV95627.1 GAF and HTH_10 associated domain-containing protein [Halobacterium jilantaiense]